MCSCVNIKNESVRVIAGVNQTDSFPDAFVIQVNKAGKYFVYIPNESDRAKYNSANNSKVATKDSIMEIQLPDLGKSIAIYEKVIKGKDLKIKIEADLDVEYKKMKNLMNCLQDEGYTNWSLTTKPKLGNE